MKLGRPVKWVETRSENYQSTTHGRDHVQDVELAATKDGKILGLRCTVWAGMGAYLSTAAPGIPTILHGLMLSGPVRGAGREGRRVRRLHEHHAGRGLSRRRTSRGDVHARADDRSAGRRDQNGSGRGPPAQPHSPVRQRLRRRDGPEVRQRQLSGRARQGARTRRVRQAARRAGRRARQGPVSRDRRHDLRRDLRPRAVAGGGRHRLPGRPLGERDRPLPSERQGSRVHRRLAARSGRRDDVRADRGRRAWRRR